MTERKKRLCIKYDIFVVVKYVEEDGQKVIKDVEKYGSCWLPLGIEVPHQAGDVIMTACVDPLEDH